MLFPNKAMMEGNLLGLAFYTLVLMQPLEYDTPNVFRGVCLLTHFPHLLAVHTPEMEIYVRYELV